MSAPAAMAVLSNEWRLWIAENLSRGVEPEDIVTRLLEEGVPDTLARHAVQGFSREPRLLPGLAARCARLEELTPAYLGERWGEVSVDVTVDRASDAHYAQTFHRRVRAMPLRELVRAMDSGSPSDIYLVAENHALSRTRLGEMLRALELPAGWGRPLLWMGPEGTLTPFHHDAIHLLVLQAHGRKRWRFIAPTEPAWLAQVGAAPLTLDEPREDVRVRELVVGPGDAVEVPAGWWHQVLALDASVTLSLGPAAPLAP